MYGQKKLTKKLLNGSLMLGPRAAEGRKKDPPIEWVSNGHWMARRSLFDRDSTAILDAPEEAIKAAFGTASNPLHFKPERVDSERVLPREHGLPVKLTAWRHDEYRSSGFLLVEKSDRPDPMAAMLNVDYVNGLGLESYDLELHPNYGVSAWRGEEIVAYIMILRFHPLPGSTLLPVDSNNRDEIRARIAALKPAAGSK